MNRTGCVKGPLSFLIVAMLCSSLLAGPTKTRCTVSLVQVRADQAIMPVSSETLRTLLYCDAVAGRAMRDVLAAEFDPNGGLFRVESIAADRPDVVQLVLEVNLPVMMEAAAAEFGNALVENLRVELGEVFDVHIERLQERLSKARLQVESAEKRFGKALEQGTPDEDDLISLHPADELVYLQLDETVDLSALNRDMSFGEAVHVLRQSVDPPLEIVVLWKDLSDNAEIEPTTKIDMDGPGAVRLDAGLKALLNAVAGGFTQLDYVIDGAVVTVATIDSLPMHRMEACVHRVPPLIRAMGQTRQLMRVIMETVEPESWFEMSEFGEGTIQTIGDAELLIRQTRPIHREIQQLLRQIATAHLTTLPVDVSPETLAGHLRLLMSYRDKLQRESDSIRKDLAELERARADAQERYSRNSWDTVHNDLLGIIDELETLKTKIADEASDPPSADGIDRIIRKAKACIHRSEEHPPVRRPGGFSCLGPLWPASPEEQMLEKGLTSQQAALEALTDRIGELDRLLIGPRIFDPDVDRIRNAAERLRRAIARVDDLERRLSEAEAPSVTILGAMD